MPSKVTITKLKEADAEAQRLSELFAQAEQEINNKLLRMLAKNNGTGYTASQLRRQKAQIRAMLDDLADKASKQIYTLTEHAYYAGAQVAEQQLKAAQITILGKMGGINAKVVKAYASQLQSRIADVVTAAGRSVTDIYKVVDINRALTGTLAGYESINTTERKILDRVENGEGIIGFVDSAGRVWTMERYVDMLTRTSTMRLFNEAKKNEFIEHREDLVIVSSHGGGCDLCKPYDGAILSLTGATEGYTTLDEAEAEGLFHPNCRHTYDLYIDENNPELGIIGEKDEPAEDSNGQDNGQVSQEETAARSMLATGTADWEYIGDKGMDNALTNTNPNYNRASYIWSHNCQRCVPTYEMRRRGFNVTAKPRIINADDLPKKSVWSTIFENSNLENVGARTKKDLQPKIEQKLLAWGNGARAEVRVSWKKTKNTGHVFVAENVNGVVKFIDPQNGDKDCAWYFDLCKPQQTEIMRIDNLKTSDLILQCCDKAR